jgi:hypothetical protein
MKERRQKMNKTFSRVAEAVLLAAVGTAAFGWACHSATALAEQKYAPESARLTANGDFSRAADCAQRRSPQCPANEEHSRQLVKEHEGKKTKEAVSLMVTPYMGRR